ncbi:MAG: cob(I)alamin adenosyltransferase [Miltoncostaeaceae bacterium]|nr:cob(I)alamin adenosyltransferase [Miltoncostaeaceae bacterium]
MVRLTRIYTRLGDGGDTHLGDMSRVRKTNARIAAFGEVDELNSVIGVARLQQLPAGDDERLARIQNDLFDVGADMAVPEGTPRPEGAAPPLRVTAEQVERLERWCDEVNAALEPLRSFVLPGGTPAAAVLHHARAVCRRAERAAVALGDAETLNPQAITYLNRLSDLLFILARGANRDAGGDVLWLPGGPPV